MSQMASGVPSLRYGELTYLETRACAEQGWLALVPTGCTEQQGPHIVTGFDTWFAETLMLAAAEQAAERYGVRALVLPAMPFGPTPEHRSYGSGYIHVPVRLHDELVQSVLESLAEQGFQKLVIWRGCGGHALSEMVAQFNSSHEGQARAFLPGHPYYDIWCRLGDPAVPSGHADSFTTSITLHLRPDFVRPEQVYDPKSREPDWGDPNLDFGRYSTSGVIGDPTHASAALGAKLWDAVVESAAQTIKEIATG